MFQFLTPEVGLFSGYFPMKLDEKDPGKGLRTEEMVYYLYLTTSQSVSSTTINP